MENDLRKDNIIIFISKENLHKRIIANIDNYHLLFKKGFKYPSKIGKLQFAQVLVDKSHDIQRVNTIFFNNLVKLATDGASI